jgi:hypothetical protein
MSPVENIPACGPQGDRPLRVRVLRYASLVLATAGLVLLYLYSVSRDIPAVRVADITQTMNFAGVRMAGEVSGDTFIFKSGGMVFNLNDGSGEIAVLGGRAQADALKAAGKIPRRGDRVEVRGTLSVSEGQEPKLRMQSSGLVLHRKPAAVRSAGNPIPLADITAARQGQWISVAGTLKSVDIPGPGSKKPYVLTLEEGGAQLAVIFWEDVFQGLEQGLPVPGSRVCADGRIDVYKGVAQLRIREAADLRAEKEK